MYEGVGNTVNKNIIGAPKMQIIYLYYQIIVIFSKFCNSNIWLFSLFFAPHEVIAFNLACLIFGISSLLLYLVDLFKAIALPTIAIVTENVLISP